ncbi:hypothetical protein DYB32_007415 [Aphanomyces invadans]|uniref:DDE-1 domain-containing protein n=1 Tax=Aphanomyces invadans TaxID=157072 RepID=A0A3R6ZLM4_9STRA|nr:hypothetical protein DYB32_007415 [Aphanomyces invadans]
MRGVPNGLIQQNEFDDYPIGHRYAVQESAWVDDRVWALYLRSVVRPKIKEPSLLILDNFEPHVSAKGVKIAAEEAGCTVVPLPPNTTSITQPLDVGIMAPFKRHLRDLWLQEDMIEGGDEDVADLMTIPARRKRLALTNRAIKAWVTHYARRNTSLF